jgi:hypothetical protein
MNVPISDAGLNCCRTPRRPMPAAANADPNDCVSLLSLGRLGAVPSKRELP